MLIDISKIDPGGLPFDTPLELQPESGDDLVIEGAHIAGTVFRESDAAVLTADLSARATQPCSRCLEPTPLGIATRFELTLVRELPQREGGESEVKEEEIGLYVASEGKLDLRAVALEQIYLNLPLKVMCSDTCQGLCPTCGANRNLVECGCSREQLDPRLAALADLKQRMGDS